MIVDFHHLIIHPSSSCAMARWPPACQHRHSMNRQHLRQLLIAAERGQAVLVLALAPCPVHLVVHSKSGTSYRVEVCDPMGGAAPCVVSRNSSAAGVRRPRSASPGPPPDAGLTTWFRRCETRCCRPTCCPIPVGVLQGCTNMSKNQQTVHINTVHRIPQYTCHRQNKT
jgi:hypothetical protein